MENVSQLWELLASNGLAGVLLGVGVFLLVYLGRFSGFVKDGKIARIAAAVSSLLVGGAAIGDVDSNVSSIVAILVSGLIHELSEFISEKRSKEEE